MEGAWNVGRVSGCKFEENKLVAEQNIGQLLEGLSTDIFSAKHDFFWVKNTELTKQDLLVFKNFQS